MPKHIVPWLYDLTYFSKLQLNLRIFRCICLRRVLNSLIWFSTSQHYILISILVVLYLKHTTKTWNRQINLFYTPIVFYFPLKCISQMPCGVLPKPRISIMHYTACVLFSRKFHLTKLKYMKNSIFFVSFCIPYLWYRWLLSKFHMFEPNQINWEIPYNTFHVSIEFLIKFWTELEQVPCKCASLGILDI